MCSILIIPLFTKTLLLILLLFSLWGHVGGKMAWLVIVWAPQGSSHEQSSWGLEEATSPQAALRGFVPVTRALEVALD